MKTKTLSIVAAILAVVAIVGALFYSRMTADVPNEDGASAQVKVYDEMRGLRFCEIFLIGGNALTGNLEAAVYSTIGLNHDVSGDPLDSAPQSLVDRLDMNAIKKEYGVLTAFLNEPRHYIMDRLEVPTGAERVFNGLRMRWVAASHIKKPKGDMSDKSWLRYRRNPVERSTTITFKAGRPVFLLDDPDGKVWVMKAYRAAYGQTYESLSSLGERYKSLPAGYKTRVVVLEKDLILRPTGSVATVMQDEFENTYDYLGDGSSNYVP